MKMNEKYVAKALVQSEFMLCLFFRVLHFFQLFFHDVTLTTKSSDDFPELSWMRIVTLIVLLDIFFRMNFHCEWNMRSITDDEKGGEEDSEERLHSREKSRFLCIFLACELDKFTLLFFGLLHCFFFCNLCWFREECYPRCAKWSSLQLFRCFASNLEHFSNWITIVMASLNWIEWSVCFTLVLSQLEKEIVSWKYPDRRKSRVKATWAGNVAKNESVIKWTSFFADAASE